MKRVMTAYRGALLPATSHQWNSCRGCGIVIMLRLKPHFRAPGSMGQHVMVKEVPTRTDAYVMCPCGGTAAITAVAPIPDEPDQMRHTYACLECGKEMKFDVAKLGKEPAQEKDKE